MTVMHLRAPSNARNFLQAEKLLLASKEEISYVFLTVHLSIILDNDQLGSQLLYFTILLL